MKLNVRLQFLIIICALLCAVQAGVSASEVQSAAEKAKFERSRDTHEIDESRYFPTPKGESPTETVDKAAERQIEDSVKPDDTGAGVAPGTGTVMVQTKEKQDASRESTKVGRDNPADNFQVPSTKEVQRPTVALALGGGGARGAAHIGVLRVLKEANIPIDYIVGNSMGSIIGGLYSAGVPLDDIEAFMVSGKLRKAYMPGSVVLKLLTSPVEKMMNPFRKHYAGLWSGKKFAKFLEKQLPEKMVNVEDTEIPFSAVATNLIDGKAYRISDGKLSTAIRASSTIPTILQPVAIGDKVYVDGGVRANLPASAARDTGAKIVIAVLVDEPLRELPASRFRHLKAIAERLGDVMLAVADSRQLPFADIIINPDVSGVAVLSKNGEDARKAIIAGETATRKALPEIKKRLYGQASGVAAKDKESQLTK